MCKLCEDGAVNQRPLKKMATEIHWAVKAYVWNHDRFWIENVVSWLESR